MATEWISPTWRMPNDKNQSKFENYSLDFGGASADFIDCGAGIGNSIGDNYTSGVAISLWFKADTTSNQEKGLFIFEGSTAWGEITAYFYFGKLELRVQGDDKNLDYTFSDTSSFHHLLINFLGPSADNQVYLDGAAIGPTFTYLSSGLDLNGEDLKIGYTYSTSYPFRGKMSDFCVFKNSLSTDQISYLYNSGTPQNPMAISGQLPIAYYPLGGSSTGDAGISPNTLTVPNESVPSATVFDFSSDKIDLGLESNLGLGGTSKYSTSLWFKKSTNGSECLWGYNYGDANGSGYYFWLNSGALRTAVGKDGETTGFGFFEIAAVDLPIDTWQNIVVVFDGTLASGDDRIKVYHNGAAAVGSYANGSSFPATLPTGNGASNRNVYLGQLQLGNGSFSYNFSGEMSNVMQWTTDLSLSDANTIYNNGVPLFSGTQPQAANLKAWYPMNVENANWLGSDWQIADATSAYPQSFDFSGTDYIKVNNSPSIEPAKNLTVSVWVNWKTGSNTYSYAINKDYNGSNGSYAITRVNQPRFYIYTSTGVVVSPIASSVNLTDTGWHHLVGTYDGLYVRFYVNGEEIGSGTAETGDIIYNTEDLLIGAFEPSGNLSPNGEQSNVQIWDSALPATGTDSVETLYNNGSPLTTAIASSNLKAWYKLDNTDKWNSTSSNWSIYNNKYPIPTPTYTSAIRYDAGYYNPPGKYAGIGFTDTAFSGSHVSISVWYRWPEGNNGTLEFMNTGSDPYIVFDGGSSGRRLFVGKFGQKYKSFVTDITDGNWHHYLLYFENTATIARSSMRLWQDGIEIIGADAGSGAEPSALTIARGIGSANLNGGGVRSTFNVSNFALFNTDQTGNLSTLYNGGAPGDISSLNPLVWYKADSANVQLQSPGAYDITFTDSSGNNNTGTGPFETTPPPYSTIETTNVIAREAATSSGMTESNLVNNNVSALNGTSSGMTTANLVNSDLTRSIPYSSYSMFFDGIDDVVQITRSADLEPANITVSCWVNVNATGSHTSGYFVSKIHTSGASASYGIYKPATPTFLIKVGGVTKYSPAYGTDIRGQGWQHLVGTYDGANIRLYVNGVEVGSGTAETGSIDYTTEDAYIGSFEPSSLEIDGNISNTAIFTSALTQDQILTIYNGGVPNSISSLSPVGWWSLAGDSYYNGTDWICPDLGSGGNNGTSSGMGGSELVGDAPGGSANGTATSMNIPANLKGDAPNSSSNAFSVNMNSEDRVPNVPA